MAEQHTPTQRQRNREFLLPITLHTDARPHWSTTVDWRRDRWDPMTNAPRDGYPILMVRGRTAEGKVLEPMHYACGDGDGLMAPFDGWFVPYGNGCDGFYQVRPVEWQPIRAALQTTGDKP
jgi:hypothetical protein